MSKYHVNQKTGRSGVCRATEKRGCPLGADTPHFDSKEEANSFIEKNEKEKNNTFSKISKTDSNGSLSDSNINVQSLRKSRPSIYNVGEGVILRGKTMGEIEENIRKDYELYKRLPRMSESEFVNSIMSEASEGTAINPPGEYRDRGPYYDGVVYNSSINVDDSGNGIIRIKTEDYIDEEPQYHPLNSSRELLERNERSRNDDSYYYEPDDGERVYSYDYRLSQDEVKSLTNQKKFEKLDEIKNTLDNPNLPNWAIHPQVKYSGNPYEISQTRRIVSNSERKKNDIENKITTNQKFLDSVEKNNSNARKKNNEIKKLNNELNEINEAIKNSNSDTVRRALEAGRKDIEIKIENNQRMLKSYQSKSSNEAVKKRIESNAKLVKELEEISSNADSARRILLEEYLTSRYPHENGNTRRTAARKWLSENPEAHKTFNIT